MWDSNEDAGCLYDSVTETVFGRRFLVCGAEKAEAFLAWCLREHGDPRRLPVEELVELQDVWLLALDTGCATCFAEPWESCDVSDEFPHPRAPRKPVHPGLQASIEAVTGGPMGGGMPTRRNPFGFPVEELADLEREVDAADKPREP